MATTKKDMIATRYLHTLHFDALDRKRHYDAIADAKELVNRIQTKRIRAGKDLTIIQAPKLTWDEPGSHLSKITWITKEELTQEEQTLINQTVLPRERDYNISIGEKAEE